MKIIKALSALLFAVALASPFAALAGKDGRHQVVIQVTDADPGKWNLALNVAENLQEAYGKAKEKGGAAAARAKDYLDDAKKYLGEARERMTALAAKSREQAEILYNNAKEQYEILSAKAKDLYGKAKTRISEVDFKTKGDEVVEYVRANPGKAVLIALAIGFVVGYATRPRD